MCVCVCVFGVGMRLCGTFDHGLVIPEYVTLVTDRDAKVP